MKIKFKIRRYNPSEGAGAFRGRRRADDAAYYQAYNVEVSEGMTVLEALMKIYEEQDSTLGFRRSCRSAICGSCAVRVNGFSRLACKTQIIPEYKKMGSMVLEPLANHTPVKDLMVDFSPFWTKMGKITPFLTPNDETAGARVSNKDVRAIDNSQKCIMCGCCNSECNALEVDPRYLGPAAHAKAWRFVGDVREGNTHKRLARLSDEHGMWDCVRCIHCTQYCPKDVNPLKAIELLRSAAMNEGLTDNHGARHVESMLDSVRKLGRLDEAAMTFKTLGFLRSLGMIPFGINLELHGKMPKLHLFAQIEGIEEVKTICEEFDKRRSGAKEKG